MANILIVVSILILSTLEVVSCKLKVSFAFYYAFLKQMHGPGNQGRFHAIEEGKKCVKGIFLALDLPCELWKF